jgi:hypothetical protein
VWSISHVGPYNGAVDQQFAEYLSLLRGWSDKRDGHDVVTVTLDLKGKPLNLIAFPWRLDEYIAKWFGDDKLFTPAMLQKDGKDLVAGAMKHGWPPLRDLRSKFIFCLSGDEDAKDAYARSGKSRLCFADKNLKIGGRYPSTKSGDRVFFNLDVGSWPGWEKQAKWIAKRKGFVSRGYVINDGGRWKKAIECGINILATDKVRKHKWAKVGTAPFVRI